MNELLNWMESRTNARADNDYGKALIAIWNTNNSVLKNIITLNIKDRGQVFNLHFYSMLSNRDNDDRLNWRWIPCRARYDGKLYASILLD